MTVLQSQVLYYSIIILTSLALVLLMYLKDSRFRTILFYSIISYPIFISAFRYGIGSDYFNYEIIYHQISGGLLLSFQNTRFEPGWIILNYLINIIFNDAKYVFIITSILIWVISFKALYDNRDKIHIGVASLIMLATLYNQSFNIIRQSLAIAIVMLTIKLINDRKPFKYTMVILLAASFHYTALIFLPIYWLVNGRVKGLGIVKKVVTAILFVISIIMIPHIVNFLSNIEAFSTYSSHYNLELQDVGIGNIIIRIPIILVMLLNYQDLKRNGNLMGRFVYVYLLGLILQYVGYYAEFANRIADFYFFVEIFVLSAIYKNQKVKMKRALILIVILIYYIAWFSFYIIYLNRHQTIPYLI